MMVARMVADASFEARSASVGVGRSNSDDVEARSGEMGRSNSCSSGTCCSSSLFERREHVPVRGVLELLLFGTCVVAVTDDEQLSRTAATSDEQHEVGRSNSGDEQHEVVVVVVQMDERHDALPLDASLSASERGVLAPEDRTLQPTHRRRRLPRVGSMAAPASPSAARRNGSRNVHLSQSYHY